VKVLPDTSIWVDFLRHGTAGPATALDGLLAEGSIVVCGPVLSELLVGTHPEDHDELWTSVGSLPWADIDREGWKAIGEVGSRLRKRGHSLPLTDLMIAVAAATSNSALWSRDQDFAAIAEVYPRLELFPAPS
jgi:predicted nucleic acid-binding protein